MKKDNGDKLMEQAFGDPKYRGKHVIVIGGQIFSAATGKQAQKILEDVNKKYPKEIPIITYIPKSESLILWLPLKDLFVEKLCLFEERIPRLYS